MPPANLKQCGLDLKIEFILKIFYWAPLTSCLPQIEGQSKSRQNEEQLKKRKIAKTLHSFNRITHQMSHVVAPSRNDCFSKEKVEASFISTSLSQSLGDFNRLGKKHSWHFWPKSLLTILRGGPESRKSEIGCFCLQLKNMFNCIALLVNIRLNIGKFYEISRPLQIWIHHCMFSAPLYSASVFIFGYSYLQFSLVYL